ncbi:FtsX-like permease family protein [Dactylosporangium sp. NPDC050688]|uniref:FtsX-like permease family protein n=1 Tax=Dactylosporangium sp. NPDC050688 TaxID=3157217 RepID=UPI0033E0D36F
MIGLVLSMIRARPGQAVTAFVLAMFAMAAAVSAPVYVTTADRAVVASEVEAAPVTELVVQARRDAKAGDRAFEDLVPKVFTFPGFSSVFSAEFNTYVRSATPGVEPVAPRMVYRDDSCAHVRFLEGRCFISQSEIILSRQSMDQLKSKVGGTLEVAAGAYDAEGREWVPIGAFGTMTVVGVYEPLDKTEQYWADFDYFNDRPTDRLVTAPILAGRLTLESVERVNEKQALDVVIDHDVITGDSLAAVNAAVESGRSQLAGLSGAPTVKADLPELLKRIERNRGLVAQVVPVAAVPLVLLCWFVLFIAVTSATAERRLELGLLALRGATFPRRWWLAAGESIVPILFGGAAGFLLGHYLVRLAAWLLLSTSGDVPLSAGANRWAVVALAGAVLAAVLAQRAELAKRTIDLLRNVPGRLSRWGAPVFEVAVVVLAVVAVLQLREGDGGLTGFAIFGPSLVVIAFGLLAARGVLPLAERTGRRALRRGRIGPTLAAYAMARRPGSQRILALFVVAIALACFATTAATASDDNRDTRIRVEQGADRVLTVEPVGRTQLLGKVRAIDPEGDFAMATTMLPPSDDSGVPPMLAVDSSRLARVALWNDPHFTAAEAAAALRPDVARDSIIVDNKDVSIDVTVDKLVDAFRVRLVVVVVPLDGSTVGEVDFGAPQLGRHTYTRNLPMCVNTCRFAALQINQPEGRGFDATITLHGMTQRGEQITDFGTAGEWRVPETPGPRLLVPDLDFTGDGLRMEVSNYKGADVAFRLLPTDFPAPLPVVMARTAGIGDHMSGFDLTRVSAQVAGEVGQVPRMGVRGGIVDLEYMDRISSGGGDTLQPQIWLNDRAPADVLDRVAAQGLVVMSDQRLGPRRAALDEQGPAVALRFHEFAAGLAVLLAGGALWLVAALDRQRRRGELRALRAQGVARRDASANGYLALVGTAAVIGPFAALASWLLVREHLPVFTDDPGTFPVPIWPSPLPVAAAWAVAVLALTGVVLLAGARLRAATRQR